jgi:hypothetical protein
MYAEAKAHSVYSVTIVAKPRILIEGRISHDEVPLDARNRFGAPGLPQILPSNSSRSSPVTTVVIQLYPPVGFVVYLT